jgi:hypothetical protein
MRGTELLHIHNIYEFAFFLLGFIYSGYFSYCAWFSPKKYAKLVVFLKKLGKAYSIIYIDSIYEFLFSKTGAGLWINRIIYTLSLFLTFCGMVFWIFGK